MPFRLAGIALRLASLLGVAFLMLVPTGMCICGDCADESATQPHQPGCPEVRKLDRPPAPDHYAGDNAVIAAVALVDHDTPAGPPRVVRAVGPGPPRGRPLYLALQTLLI